MSSEKERGREEVARAEGEVDRAEALLQRRGLLRLAPILPPGGESGKGRLG